MENVPEEKMKEDKNDPSPNSSLNNILKIYLWLLFRNLYRSFQYVSLHNNYKIHKKKIRFLFIFT